MKGKVMLPKKAILEFQQEYKKEFGISLTLEQSLQKAEDFIQLFDLITRKFPEVKDKHNCSESLLEN